MNIARKLCTIRYQNVRKNFSRQLRLSVSNYDSSASSQPQVQEEKFDFEDLKVLERTERRKAKIAPFMKDVFVSIFNRDLLAFPEILDKDESSELESRVAALEKVFLDPQATKQDKRNALKRTNMFAAPTALTDNGLAMNYTESLRFLEVISNDLQLGLEVSDHWVCLQALRIGLSREFYQNIISDVTSGENTIALCVKERIAERPLQADFRTKATLHSNGIWHITGEKLCLNSAGYLLVLCLVDDMNIRAFLVHPKAAGLSQNGNLIVFRDTPATPLDMATEQSLASVLGATRLHTATLYRTNLLKIMKACVEYTKPLYFSGKPLSELSTIRNTIGEALLRIYASESAEYFTAGLLDGYESPDADLEVAMCRNYIAYHGHSVLMDLLAIQGVERHQQCLQQLQDTRSLALRGENAENINMFIALNGIHHAGKMMAEEIKQIRNPLFNPSFIIKKIVANRHQEKDEPKLNLHLAEHLHPSLRRPAEQLEYSVVRMRYACETLMSRHGRAVGEASTELIRLAEAATEVLVMSAVLARASRSYCIGLRNGELEMKLAACFVERSKGRVRRLIREIDDGEYLNLDRFRIDFGKKVLESNSVLVEKPTAVVFW